MKRVVPSVALFSSEISSGEKKFTAVGFRDFTSARAAAVSLRIGRQHGEPTVGRRLHQRRRAATSARAASPRARTSTLRASARSASSSTFPPEGLA